MKLNEGTRVSTDIKTILAIVAGVAVGVFAYTELTARLVSLETSRELFQADLLKKSEQLPVDQDIEKLKDKQREFVNGSGH